MLANYEQDEIGHKQRRWGSEATVVSVTFDERRDDAAKVSRLSNCFLEQINVETEVS